MSYFSDLGLAEPVLRALGTKGYADPTPIQREAIPALLEGRDLLGIAQTGTGKTAAFSLPSLHRLAADPKPKKNASCRMLVLSPTRELAAQIAENMRGYAKYLALNIQCVFGGVPVGRQARALVPGCDILVATPGRLLDLIDQRALTLRHVEIFVLDEADQMMDLGFINPLKRIAAMLPKERQSLFFSATMPKAIADLGKQFIENPVRVEVAPQSTTAERVEQYAVFLNQAEKQALLTMRLRDGLGDNTIDRALVFTRTKHGADRVVRHLASAGVSAAAIHGNKSQAQRTAAIKGFRSGSVRVLVATDIAARGIDIPGVSHVFNFEMPNVPEQYVHRIGRTARAGADGIAVSFVAPDEKPYLRDIERLTRVKLTQQSLPEDFEKQASRLPLPSRKQVQEAVAEDGRPAHHQARGRGRDGQRGDGRQRDGERAPRQRQERGPAKARTDRTHIRSDRLPGGGEDRAARPQQSRSRDDRSARPERVGRPEQGQRTGERGYGERSYGERSHGERSHAPRGDRMPRENNRRDGAPREGGQRDGGPRDNARRDGGRRDGPRQDGARREGGRTGQGHGGPRNAGGGNAGGQRPMRRQRQPEG
ncbi:putative helicase [Caenibius tardaugens NBRC 16725]|uniref:Putative helicase n=1 Tax=Caenibius tardaugens NBRC 16725 TaxID=1219035 RepID=U2YIU8_9SPHN|nr:DEAD/DEAH box helicase [Caenibius tardaugens]AZI34569.1 DEAD/DEAH box helicase [Caenibius tardaugens NBRC 16725]GAD48072.1 putative helicase [Caenibius tardaugens NBRC 16725]